MRTSGSGSGADALRAPPTRYDGRGFLFWYPSTHLAKARASCRYRIGHLTEHLVGATAVIGPRLPARALEGIHTVVCLRPHVDAELAEMLGRLRTRHRLRLVADYDDLLFDCPVEAYPHARRDPAARETYASRLAVYRQSPAFFDELVASTEPIAERMRALFPRARVRLVPNGVSRTWVAAGNVIARRFAPGDPKIVRYLPGSPTHDDDFAVARPSLARFLATHDGVRLEIVGPLRFDPDAFPAGSVVVRPRVPYELLPRWLASSWVNLAPTAATGYGRSRSALKLLEAGAFGVPTIATPTPDYARHAESGVRFASDDDAWLAHLVELLDETRRMELGRTAEAHVRKRGTSDQSVAAWASAFGARRMPWPR